MKMYLGDSVYVERDGGGVVLTAENGYGPSNTIVLEADVLDAFLGFVSRLAEAVSSGRLLPAAGETQR